MKAAAKLDIYSNFDSTIYTYEDGMAYINKPGNYKEEFQNSKLLSMIKQITEDQVSILGTSKSYNPESSKKFSKKGKNVLYMEAVKFHNGQSNLKLLLFKGEDPNKEENSLFWITWHEDNRMVIKNLKTGKFLETNPIKQTKEPFVTKIIFYLAKETNTLVLSDSEENYITAENLIEIFEDDLLSEVDHINILEFDSYNVNILKFSSFAHDFSLLEDFALLRINLNENFEYVEHYYHGSNCSPYETFNTAIKYRCSEDDSILGLEFMEQMIVDDNVCNKEVKMKSFHLCKPKYNKIKKLDLNKILCFIDNEKNRVIIKGLENLRASSYISKIN